MDALCRAGRRRPSERHSNDRVDGLIPCVAGASPPARRTARWEIDPDLRLFVRLSIGRPFQVCLTILLWTALLAAFATGAFGTFETTASFLRAPVMAVGRAFRPVLLTFDRRVTAVRWPGLTLQ